MRQIEPMSLERLLTKFQAYYGGMYEKPHVEAFLDEFGEYDEYFIGAIYSVIVKKYSIKWGKLPDVAIVYEFIDNVHELASGARSASVVRLDEPMPTEEEREIVKAKLRALAERLKTAKTINVKDGSLPAEEAVVR